MDPARKRRTRLVVALTAAVLLAGALVYTSFSASSEAVQPSALAAKADSGRTYQLTGKVVNGSIRKHGDTVADGVQSVEVVSDQEDGQLEPLLKRTDQLVEAGGGDRVEPGGRLV